MQVLKMGCGKLCKSKLLVYHDMQVLTMGCGKLCIQSYYTMTSKC
jgi:hypothetical protein